MSLVFRALSFVTGLLAVPLVSQGAAITAPYLTYFEEFTAGDSVLPFAESNSSVSGTTRNSSIFDRSGDLVLRTELSATGTGSSVGANSSNSVTTSPSIVGSNFVLSTNVTLQSFSQSSANSTLNILVSALAPGTDLGSSSTGYRLVYTVHASSGSGNLRLEQQTADGLTATTTLTSTGTITATAGMNFTLTLTGTYTGNRIDLLGTMTSGSTTLTVSGFDNVATTTTNFGVRSALNSAPGTTSTMVVDYNSFSLIPEPGAGVLVALGLGTVALRRRRS